MKFFFTNLFSKAPAQISKSEFRPSTVVIRPSGCLDSKTSPAFIKSLEQALELATDTVVVDMIAVNAIKREGVKSLLHGMEKAAALGKTLTFEFLDVATQRVLEAAWNYEI
ncbi:MULTISPECIES: STAS domain-containing protein [Cyanophyceae]|jgi:anti-anti-sigma regulatory factor|uniref:STAS domain-containing protein n=1 Tax=Cyanophyceae TaxID=3028117 RepID=UPI001688AB76|nr:MULTISPECIES: STAS domain-containing protein [unclassified Trichocoleus]MBD1904629.1 STAS domain-containing protein [Trichocoleus sp. FACHB-832]MBD1935253.1 STAS domain-containing protein [Trichocoleus sp. FACHB-69]MBD2002656.1 STAS domain-containing protein [Trichocoleus sp. FACHB-40]MBD2062428.1 STAS domain-containing protein [Trichocoleus sp. FACHB-6]